MIRLQVALDPIEAEVLGRLAASELRDPRDQIRLIVRQELQRRGLLPPPDAGGAPQQPEPAEVVRNDCATD